MRTEYYKIPSYNLSMDMEFKVYGYSGKPVLAFPCTAQKFYDFENMGMIDAISYFINNGIIRLYCADTIDYETWDNVWAHPAERMIRHNDYDNYIIHELVPFIYEHSNSRTGIMTTGVSMGATHAANFFFRHPDVFDSVIALSGIYKASFFLGDYMDENIKLNSPIDFLSDLEDEWFLEKYRQSQLVFCVGQGAWEDPMLGNTLELKRIFEEKNIPAWVDIWGNDVCHDWPWWHKQMPYFLQKLLIEDNSL